MLTFFFSQSPICFPRYTCSVSKHSEPTINKSLYEVLRVKRNASQTEIKTAYRTLAKLYHPDATAKFMKSSMIAKEDEDDEEEFIEIHNAYATLSDPDARAVYDANFDFNSPKFGRFYSTRKWETDQCW